MFFTCLSVSACVHALWRHSPTGLLSTFSCYIYSQGEYSGVTFMAIVTWP